MADHTLRQDTVLHPDIRRRRQVETSHFSLARLIFVCLLLLIVIGGCFFWQSGLWRPMQTVTIEVNGRREQVRSRQATIEALFKDLGYDLTAQDIVYPPRAAPLSPDQPISLILARDMTVVTDGTYQRLLTHVEHVKEVLVAQEIVLGAQDVLLLDGLPVSAEARLPMLAEGSNRPRGELSVVRALPIEVDDEGNSLTFTTRQQMLGQALLEQDVVLHEGDNVTPALNTPIYSGMQVRIRRTTPFIIEANGQKRRTRTASKTVGTFLAQQGLVVRDLDILTPAPDTLITEELQITLTRIDHETIVEREAIPFEQLVEKRDYMPLNSQQVVQAGSEGSYARETLIIYENGVEKERILEREYVEREPQDEIIALGTQALPPPTQVVRNITQPVNNGTQPLNNGTQPLNNTTQPVNNATNGTQPVNNNTESAIGVVETEKGPRQYSHKIEMLATSYTAATSGKTRDHPAYGITRSGVLAGFGVVAVDPRVIPLGTYVYVPGYGIGYAGDTGGAIKGARIDLGYDEWNLRLWYSTVEVYVLTSE